MKLAAFIFTLVLVPAIAASQEHQIQLRGQQQSIVLLKNLTNVVMPNTAPSNSGCVAESGDNTAVLFQMADKELGRGWLRIRMISGPCAGEEGWINSENAQPT